MDTSITDMLNNDPDFRTAIDDLKRNKPYKKILIKACEELNELSTKLLQKVNNYEKVTDEEIGEEIIDAQMHLILLTKLISPDIIIALVKQKKEKFLASKERLKYKS